MYTCIKDPETGRRLYADVGVTFNSTTLKLNELNVRDVATEDMLVKDIIIGLRGIVIKDPLLLSIILNDAFGISTGSCPELRLAVQERLKEAGFEGVML